VITFAISITFSFVYTLVSSEQLVVIGGIILQQVFRASATFRHPQSARLRVSGWHTVAWLHIHPRSSGWDKSIRLLLASKDSSCGLFAQVAELDLSYIAITNFSKFSIFSSLIVEGYLPNCF